MEHNQFLTPDEARALLAWRDRRNAEETRGE
jgi:hypothetical protein